MEWQAYKTRCDQGDVLSRWMLQQTSELLDRAGAARLTSALAASMAAPPLEKPADHKGGTATDMFVVTLSPEETSAVLAVVRQAHARGENTAGTRDRGLGGFVEAWAECLAWVAATASRRLD